MQVRVKWVGNMTFLGKSGSGHAVVMDGPVEGSDAPLIGPRPMEMLLLGAGGCTSYDVVSILRKARAQVRDCEVEVRAERADSDPKVFTHIHLHFVVTGHALKAELVQRAIHLSASKYCSATIMLGKTAEITHDFEIVEDQFDSQRTE